MSEANICGPIGGKLQQESSQSVGQADSAEDPDQLDYALLCGEYR